VIPPRELTVGDKVEKPTNLRRRHFLTILIYSFSLCSSRRRSTSRLASFARRPRVTAVVWRNLAPSSVSSVFRRARPPRPPRPRPRERATRGEGDMAATREDDGDVEARLRARWAADGRKNPDVEDALRRVGIAKARERRCVRAARRRARRRRRRRGATREPR